MTVLQFHSTKQPHRLEQAIKRHEWDVLSDALYSGGGHVLVFGIPLWAAVMREYATVQTSDGTPAPLPLSLFPFDYGDQASFEIHPNKEVTLVSWAAYCGQWDIASQLIEQGFSIEHPSCSILHMILEGEVHRKPSHVVHMNVFGEQQMPIRVIEQMLQPGERIPFNHFIKTLLAHKQSEEMELTHWAGMSVLFNHLDLLEGILTYGLDAKHIDHKVYQTHPMTVAVESENLEALNILFKHGSSVYIGDTHTVLDVAVLSHSDTVFNWVLNTLPARTLVTMLPNAMLYAVAEGNISIMEKLYEQGTALAFLEARNGYNLLHQACSSGQKDSIKWLIDKGLDLNTSAQDGVTPLHLLEQKHPRLAYDFIAPLATNVSPLFRRSR